MADPLIKLSDNNLPELINFYRNYFDCYPYIYGALHMAKKWFDIRKNYVILLTTRSGDWKNDGTIIIIFMYFSKRVVIMHTLNENYDILENALSNTKLIRFDENYIFYCIDKKFHPILVNSFENYKPKYKFRWSGSDVMTIDRETALNFTYEVENDDFLIKNIDKRYAKDINETWVHRYEDSDKDLEIYLDCEEGIGIFHKNTNEMVACVLITPINQIGSLYTKPEFRRRGFGQILIKAISKRIAKNGFKPMGTVIENNDASLAMFEKIGFKSIGKAIYFELIL